MLPWLDPSRLVPFLDLTLAVPMLHAIFHMMDKQHGASEGHECLNKEACILLALHAQCE